jgi:hypothetical protein
MLVVWTSSIGAEILLLIIPVVEGLCLRLPKEAFARVLLLCGTPSVSVRVCFALRVVNARAIDILTSVVNGPGRFLVEEASKVRSVWWRPYTAKQT